jgi:DNA invertase Pin-like site-specific DNA recombinase
VYDVWAAALPRHDDWALGAAYVRESSKDSMQGYSPSAQLKGMLEEALRRRLFIPWEHVLLDNITGRHDNRPAFLALMDLAASKKIVTMFQFHSSRFARNVALSRRWKEKVRGAGVEIVQLNIRDLNVETPEGTLMEIVQEAFDQYQSDSTAAWVRVGLRDKHEHGEELGPLPETFHKVKVGEDADGSPVYEKRPHPVLAEIVREGAEMYVARNSSNKRFGFGDLAKWSANKGYTTPSGRRLTDEWWRNTLANPLNAGLVAYRRKQMRAHGGATLLPAQVKGFLPLTLFQEVQAVRRQNAHGGGRPSRARVYVLTPMVCGDCGGQVTAAGNDRYRCRRAAEGTGACSQPSMNAEEVEHSAGAWLVKVMTVPESVRVDCAEQLKAQGSRAGNGERAAQIRRQLERLGDRYLAEDPTLPRAAYLARLRGLKVELASADHAPEERKSLEAITYALDFAKLYESAAPERKRELWRFVFKKVVVKDKKLVRVQPNALLLPLFATLQQRSRPGSEPQSRTLAGIVIEGIEDLADIADGVA